MYQTTKHFIAAAKSLKEALLLSAIVGKPLRIETGRAGAVPCIPSVPYRTIINDHLSLQAVDPTKPQRAPNRKLEVNFLFLPMQIFCNYDCTTSLMLQSLNDHPWIFMDIRDDGAPEVPQHVFEKLCYSLNLRMPPDAVKELLEFVVQDPVFAARSVASLQARYRELYDSVVVKFGDQAQKAVRATRCDREEIHEARAAGLKSGFGYGVGPRGTEDLLKICAASAVAQWRDEVTAEDLVKHFPAVTAHRVVWGEEKPRAGYVSDLTKIAEWAFRS